MILALSLSSDVKSIGAYAGFAAIIGLALLVILYFAQARETRRLSDALEEQEARLRRIPPPTAATMPRPAAAVAAATPIAQPRPVPVSPAAAAASPPTATVAVPGARRVAVTAAATLTAAPAATEALTDVRPAQGEAAPTAASTPAEEPQGSTTAATTPVEEAQGDPGPLAEPAAETSAAGESGRATAPPAGPAPSVKPPAPVTATPPAPVRARPAPQAETPAPAAAAPDSSPPSIPPAATAAGAAAAAAKPDALGEDEPGEAATTVRPAAMPLVARPVATAEAPRVADRAQSSGAAAGGEDAAPLGALADPPRPRFPPAPGERAAPVGATARISGRGDGPTATLRRERRPDTEAEADGEGRHLGSRGTLRLLAVAIVLVGVLIFVANQLLSSGSPSHPPASGPLSTSGPAPATITVAVLNGTASSGLASRVSSTLVSDGFKPGAINNAPSHNLAKTTVQYIHSADRDAAIEVAHDLALTSTQVTRADAATIAAATIAGRVPTVIALIGNNYAQ